MTVFKYIAFAVSLSIGVLAHPRDYDKQVDYAKCISDSHALFINGIENIVKTSDPLFIKFVNGDLPDLQYRTRDSRLIGLKDCKVLKLSINKEESSFEYNLECPRLQLTTKYILMGKLADIYVEGDGDLTVTTGTYIFKFHGYFERTVKENKTEYAHIKSHSVDFDPQEVVTFKFENLYGGNKEKSEILHSFISENWMFVEKKLRQGALTGFMTTFIQNLNEYLNAIPIQQIFPASC